MRPDRAIVAAALLAAAFPAQAAITCSGSNVELTLGTYVSFQSTALDSTGIFSVTCTRAGGPAAVTVSVALGPSGHSGAIATRQMRLDGGSDLLDYNIYRDISRLQVWGNTPGINAVSRTVNVPNNASRTETFTLFARIDPLQDVRIGQYRDSLTVTVQF